MDPTTYATQTCDESFACNPYTLTNVMVVWECDLLNVQNYAKYNDNYK